MEMLKIKLKPLSSFSSKLHSDFLFGEFCWGISYLYGEEYLNQLLKDFDTSPFIIFSDALDMGLLPKPLLKPQIIEGIEFKTYKKWGFVSLDYFKKNIDNISVGSLVKYIKQESEKKKKSKNLLSLKKSELLIKNRINRLSNYVNQGLYTIKEEFFNKDFYYIIYVKYNNNIISKEDIIKTFDFLSKFGLGKDRSIGKGKFKFEIYETFEEKEFFYPKENRLFFLNLSSMLYEKNDNDIILLYGKTFTKFPKMGGYYAFSLPFKNPIILYEKGSVFKVINKNKDFFGKATNEVFSKEIKEKGKFFHSGYSMGIFFNYLDY